jgi:hypothetical protein
VDGISVTVNTYRREYGLPEATTTATMELPMLKRGDEEAEEKDAEQV